MLNLKIDDKRNLEICEDGDNSNNIFIGVERNGTYSQYKSIPKEEFYSFISGIFDENNVYIQNGYESREHYLECMSEDYNVPIEVVYSLADMLEGEEFDGLVSALEDAENMGW